MAFDKSFKKAKEGILKALVYSDLFNFPLTKDEIWRFFIGEKVDRRDFEKSLTELKKNVLAERDGYYCLKGREEIILARKK